MRRGFTLLELVVAMVLLLLIGALGILTTSRTTTAAQTRGLAEEIAEELRAARQRAISNRTPTAVVFPSGGGTCGHGQGLYVLEGHTQPRITRTVSYSSHYPRACWFVGLWPASGTVTLDPEPDGTQNAGLDPTTWGAPADDDFIVMFTPSGTVRTNGLSLLDGEYRLLTSLGVEYGAGAAPSGTTPTTVTYFAAQTVAQPYTLSIAPTGAVRIHPGVTGASGLAIRDGAVAVGPPAALPAASSSGNQDPVLVACTPEPKAVAMPAGASAMASPGDYLTLRLEATDPDGDPLYVSWSAAGPHGGGSFSSASECQMEWDPGAQTWGSVWTWTPPEEAALGETYTLTYRVEDKRGGVLTGPLGSTGVVSLGTGGRIAYSTTFDFEEEMGHADADGTGAQFASPLRDGIEHYNVTWSGDGTKLASFGWDWNSTAWESVYVVNRDGTGLRELYGSQEGFWWDQDGPQWSPDGTYLVYSELDGDWWGEIWRVRLSDGQRTKLVGNGSSDIDYWQARWNADAANPRLVYVRDSYEWTDDTTTVWTCKPNGSGKTQLTPKVDGQYDYDPTFSHDGSTVAFVRWGLTTATSGLFTVPAGTGAEDQLLTGDSFSPGYPAYSPDGTLIAFLDWDSGDLFVTTNNGAHPDTGISNQAKPLTTTGDVLGFSWDPNGGQLVYSADDGQLYIATVAGPTVTALTDDEEEKNLPAWWAPAAP